MNVYILKPDGDKYQHLIPINIERSFIDLMTIRSFVGTPLGSSWRPIEVELYKKGYQGQRLLPTDFPSLAGHIPVLSERAAEILKTHLSGIAEILPLVCKNCEGNKFYAVNVTSVEDVLDTRRSDIIYFNNSERILNVNKLILRADKLSSKMIFKDPRLLLKDVFVTEDFVNLVEQNELVGLGLKRVELSLADSSN